jgi:hypothetical protein
LKVLAYHPLLITLIAIVSFHASHGYRVIGHDILLHYIHPTRTGPGMIAVVHAAVLDPGVATMVDPTSVLHAGMVQPTSVLHAAPRVGLHAGITNVITLNIQIKYPNKRYHMSRNSI